MGFLGFFGLIAMAAGVYWWALRPRLRQLAWWDGFVARLWARLKGVYAGLRGLCGNSKTIAVAYAAEILGILDEARVMDWSELLGAEAAGRVMVIMGAVMILLRLVTRTAVTFRTEA